MSKAVAVGFVVVAVTAYLMHKSKMNGYEQRIAQLEEDINNANQNARNQGEIEDKLRDENKASMQSISQMREEIATLKAKYQRTKEINYKMGGKLKEYEAFIDGMQDDKEQYEKSADIFRKIFSVSSKRNEKLYKMAMKDLIKQQGIDTSGDMDEFIRCATALKNNRYFNAAIDEEDIKSNEFTSAYANVSRSNTGNSVECFIMALTMLKDPTQMKRERGVDVNSVKNLRNLLAEAMLEIQEEFDQKEKNIPKPYTSPVDFKGGSEKKHSR